MLTLTDVSVRFGDTPALDHVTLDLPLDSVTAVLGPSGSGKTTLLRVIAGLQALDTGRVAWDGTDLTGIAPHHRRFGLMFQDYALFPHRTVGGNVTFGLRMQGHSADDQRARVTEVLQWVGLEGFEHRSIATLSGGEQQRVALARALAPAPRLLMLDEPVGSLDRLLRTRLVGELRSILRDHQITAVYVTHDQDEALSIADHLVVMRSGRVAQQGTPQEVWQRPQDLWTARFLGFENVFEELPGVSAGPVIVHADAISIGQGPLRARVAGRRFHGSTAAVTLILESGHQLEAHLRGGLPDLGDLVAVAIDRSGVVPVDGAASLGE